MDEQKKGLTADATLIGEVQLDRKALAMRVKVSAFGRTDKQPTEVCAFEATAADAGVLTEAGVSFARARGLKAKPSAKAETPFRIEEVVTDFESSLRKWDRSPVELEVRYDGKPVAIDDAKGEGAVVPAPRPGQKVTLRLRHRKDDEYTYGVVVRVNGENTVDPEKTDPLPINNRKWVLAPGKTATLDGFQLGERKSRSFEVVPLSDADAPEVRYSDRLGTIEVVVFRERTKDDRRAEELPPDDPKVINRGGLAKDEDAPSGLKELQAELRMREAKAAGARGRGIGVITKGEEKESEVKVVAFEPSPEPVASLTVRYVKPPAK
jgi:hypothetical protein